MQSEAARAPWLDATLAGNGRPVAENFRDWFGDSRVVDVDGNPIIFTHATEAEAFDVFEPSRYGHEGPGIYMAQAAGLGGESAYSGRTLDLVVRMRNPFVFYPSDESYDAPLNGELLELVLGAELAAAVIDRTTRLGVEAYGTELVDELRARGHDGILVVPPWAADRVLGKDNVAIAWDACQVKLAVGNSGLFCESNSLSDEGGDVESSSESEPSRMRE